MLLVRHAQSEWNAIDRWQGWGDIPLSPLGIRQAEAAAVAAAGLHPARVASSDLLRARQTAEIIRLHLGLSEVLIEPELREYNVGEWQGLQRAEIETRWPGALAAWSRGTLEVIPGGEVRSAFLERIARGLARLPGGAEPLLVVTHGGVIGALAAQAGLPYVSVTSLSGRWCDVGPGGTAVGGRVDLLEGAAFPD